MEGSGSTTQKILADVLNGRPPQSRHKGGCVGLVTMDQSQMWTWGRGTKILKFCRLPTSCSGLTACFCLRLCLPKVRPFAVMGLSLARGAEARGAARPLHTRARTHLTYSRSYLHPVYTEVITVKPRLAMETEKQIMRA